MSYKTSTSTGSMMGRAIIGGVLTGGAGAIIGGATAKKNTQASISGYKINITIRNMQNPIITIETHKEDVMNTLVAVLKNIIDKQR